MKRFFLVGALCLALLAPMQAWAESFTLNNITWTWDTTPTEFTVTKVFTTPQTFNLNLGASSGPTNLFYVSTESDNDITSSKTFSMNVTFDFTTPSGITDPIDVASVVLTEVNGNNNDTLKFTFSDPVYANFGNGGQFMVDVADTTFTIHNGNGVTGYIPFTVKYLTAPTADPPTGVPEPASMLLLGSGLIGLWGLRRKFRN